MRFRFYPSLDKIKIKSTRTKRLVLKAKNAPKKSRITSLLYPVRSNPIKHRYYVFIQKFKNFLTKLSEYFKKTGAKKEKPPLVPFMTLLGALCGTLLVCTVSAFIVIYTLFLSYNKPYTSITVPSLISLDESKALTVSPEIFEYETEYKSNAGKPSNTVTGQTPAAGTERKLYRGEKIKIKLIVNIEQPTFTLPNLYKASLSDALITLRSAGINVHLTRQHSSTVEAGRIISCSLPKGTVLSAGDTVMLCASLGKKTVYVAVPDLTGLDEYEATDKLRSLGLTVGDISYEASDKPMGIVISQSVKPNESLPQKSKISFTLSGGKNY